MARLHTWLRHCFNKEIDASRGDVLSLRQHPLAMTDQFEATLVWMSEDAGLIGRSYDLKLATAKPLVSDGYPNSKTLDGDNVRQGLNKDLGFTDADRVENIRRIAEVAKLMLDAGLNVCDQRDVKGLYKKARSGQLPNMTGINSPYEAPLAAQITVNSSASSVEESVSLLQRSLAERLK